MAAADSHLRTIISHVAAVRRSLRTVPSRTAGESPIEEYARLRAERRLDAVEFLRVSVAVWGFADAVAVLSVAAVLNRHGRSTPPEWWQWLTPGFFALLAAVTASAAAVATLSTPTLLPKCWLAAGLLPWAVSATECAALLFVLR